MVALAPAWTSGFAHDVLRGLVAADAEQPGMPELAVHRPLQERGLHHDLGTRPVGAPPGKALALRERRRRELEGIELPAQAAQALRVQPRADFAGEDEVRAVV